MVLECYKDFNNQLETGIENFDIEKYKQTLQENGYISPEFCWENFEKQRNKFIPEDYKDLSP